MTTAMSIDCNLGVALAIVLGTSGCGTDGDPEGSASPLTSFAATECKSHGLGLQQAEGLAGMPAALSDSANYDGLRCFEWQRTADALVLNAYNVRGGCGVTWEGYVEVVDDGEVNLILRNAICAVAACGSCIYDATYELAPDAFALDAPLRIAVFTESCEDERDAAGAALLPIDEAKQGASCEYIGDAITWDSETSGSCGQRHMACGDDNGNCLMSDMLAPPPGDGTEPQCQGDLVCGSTGMGGPDICLEPCTAGTDCSLPDLMSCIDGVCLLN